MNLVRQQQKTKQLLAFYSLKNFLGQSDCKYGRGILHFKYNAKEILYYTVLF